MQKSAILIPLVLVSMVSACLGNDNSKTQLIVRAVRHSTRFDEHTASYTTPGTSDTNCSGSATTIGNTTDGLAHCQTSSTPAQINQVTTRTEYVTDVVEANGMRYTITCTGSWRWSKCDPLNDGDQFRAEIDGNTMWIEAHQGGNQGKAVKIKYKIQDIRPVQPNGMTAKVPVENPSSEPRPAETRASNIQPTDPTPTAQSVNREVVTLKTETPSPSTPPKGITVRFTSIPSNAEIDVDGNYWGSTPTADLTRLPAGTHTITVKKIGYKPWERKIELAPGDDRTVSAELEIDPTKPHIAGLN